MVQLRKWGVSLNSAREQENHRNVPNDEEVALWWFVTKDGSADQVVVEGLDSLTRVDIAERLERRLVGTFEEERLAQVEL